MAKGISIFIGMEKTLDENIAYIKKAASLGYKKIFTSLHIPEADYEKGCKDFILIIEEAKSLGLCIIADISPRAFSYLGLDYNDLEGIANLGIYGIRIDFGFTVEEIAAFTNNPYNLVIELNASTITEKFLSEFDTYHPNYDNMQASHNYYPRKDTGISEASLQRKNELLSRYEIRVAAFIPSLVNKRGPIYEGLPTLEFHRLMPPYLSAKHLLALGIDDVFFGDIMASDEELRAVSTINEEIIDIKIELLTRDELEQKILFSNYHQNRSDMASKVIRSIHSKKVLDSNYDLQPRNTIERRYGTVTIDNRDYLRYCGELQICLTDLQKDERVNVVAKVVEEERFLLKYISEEVKWRFFK